MGDHQDGLRCCLQFAIQPRLAVQVQKVVRLIQDQDGNGRGKK